jgi:hypothetical protein
MPTADRYSRYREDQTTVWISKAAVALLDRERQSPGEGIASVLDRVLNEFRKLRRGSGAAGPPARAARGGAGAAKGPAKGAAKGASKVAAKGAAKAAGRGAAPGAAKGAGKAAGKAAGRAAAKGAARGAAKRAGGRAA